MSLKKFLYILSHPEITIGQDIKPLKPEVHLSI
jgi:hypothetical protein